ncbi:uncharacterized protein LOC126875519 [Bombus huntii]|uniref:uncharacterized protein LOC126875519 n=1 Tax=Bombus huntii TaxID=85661 RepID=UPI0021AA4A81|nr:uncharacterized protein LOC126875519 [Bombus huntii]
MAMTCVLSIAELMLHSMLAKLVMSILSRFCLNMAANVGLQYAAELLPTPVRSQGVSFIHIFGIVAHSLAPYITDSAAIWEGFPMLIISTVSFFWRCTGFVPAGNCRPESSSDYQARRRIRKGPTFLVVALLP